MIKPLRTYHYYLWRIWVVLLPVGFILAIWVIPQNQTGEYQIPNVVKAAATLVSQVPSTSYEFNLRKTDGVPGYQLELILKEKLTVPTCLVYLQTETNQLIGQLGPTGTYYFDLPQNIQNNEEVIITVQDLDTPANRAAQPQARFSDWVSPEEIAEVLWFLTENKERALRETVLKMYANS